MPHSRQHISASNDEHGTSEIGQRIRGKRKQRPGQAVCLREPATPHPHPPRSAPLLSRTFTGMAGQRSRCVLAAACGSIGYQKEHPHKNIRGSHHDLSGARTGTHPPYQQSDTYAEHRPVKPRPPSITRLSPFRRGVGLRTLRHARLPCREAPSPELLLNTTAASSRLCAEWVPGREPARGHCDRTRDGRHRGRQDMMKRQRSPSSTSCLGRLPVSTSSVVLLFCVGNPSTGLRDPRRRQLPGLGSRPVTAHQHQAAVVAERLTAVTSGHALSEAVRHALSLALQPRRRRRPCSWSAFHPGRSCSSSVPWPLSAGSVRQCAARRRECRRARLSGCRRSARRPGPR